MIGHESLGRVRKAPEHSGFAPGDLVVGLVRRPDPEPCGACARGRSDMCRNGGYRERGIKHLDGYASQAWTVEPDFAVKLDPRLAEVGVLLEPASAFTQAAGIGPGGVALVRPDGVLAWSAAEPVADPAGAVAAIVRQILCRD